MIQSHMTGADRSVVKLDNGAFIPIAAEFVYLGSTLSQYCHVVDVETRIKNAAGNAFGALGHYLFRLYKLPILRRDLCIGLILPILLYGEES